MNINLHDERVQLFYSPITRRYFIKLISDGNVVAHQNFMHCPFCGKELPPSLTKKYYDILEKEFGIDVRDIDDEIAILPKDFESDEWWKKRGL